MKMGKVYSPSGCTILGFPNRLITSVDEPVTGSAIGTVAKAGEVGRTCFIASEVVAPVTGFVNMPKPHLV